MVFMQRLNGSSPVFWNRNLYFFTNQRQDESLTFQQSSQMPGYYVFVPPNTIPNLQLVQKVRESCANEVNVLLMWVENPEEPVNVWRVHKIHSAGTGEKRVLLENAKIEIGSFQLIFSSAQVFLEENGFRFIGSIATVFSDKTDLNQMEITLQAGGDLSGLLDFHFSVQSGEQDVFRSINACLRYEAPFTHQDGTTKIHSVKGWPLHKKGSCLFRAKVDPCNPWDPARTYFKLPQESFGSSFCTPEGAPITLAAQRGACLVFEKGMKPCAYDQNPEEEWYLSPSGPFTWDTADKILCGLQGTEYVGFTTNAPKTIVFVPHKDAYIAHAGEADLSNQATTAWVRFPEKSFYSSQAIDAAYFNVDGGTNYQRLLKPMEIVLSDYMGRVPAVPVLPYFQSACGQTTVEQAAMLEAGLRRCRRKIFLDRIPPISEPQNGGVAVGATSQGLTAGIHLKSGRWEWLDLGVSAYKKERKAIRLPSPSEKTVLRMLEDELFLSYEDVSAFCADFSIPKKQEESTALYDGPSNSEISEGKLVVYADKWSFSFDPENWRTRFEETNTAIILKYTGMSSILDRMKDSPILKASLYQAYESDGETVRPQYRDFVRMVSEPGFQGTMILNCPMQYEDLPEFLQVIVGDIPKNKLYAHHVVLGASRLKMEGDTPLQEYTSICALVDFEDGEPLVLEGNPSLCDFKTLKLKLAVKDSKVVSFESTSELLANSFFGSPCLRKDTTSGNCLVLDGTCHDNGDNVEYSFSLRDSVEFNPSNNAVEAVLVDSVDLSVGSAGEQVFTLGGRMRFALVDDCDFFCYGSEREGQGAGTEQAGLTFAGMRYRIPIEGDALADYKDVFVHAQDILPRAQSFADRFPCELGGFVTRNGSSPDSEGYCAINSPAGQAALGDEWYGLDWKIDLGTLGGLSSMEGVSLHLLAAWSGSANDAPFPCYYGAKVPAAEADAFGVQGIAKIGFQSVEVRLNQPQKEPQENKTPQSKQDLEDPKQFELRLHNFNLKLLGIPLIPGSSDIVVFLDETGGQKRLGWFAAYENEKKQEGKI